MPGPPQRSLCRKQATQDKLESREKTSAGNLSSRDRQLRHWRRVQRLLDGKSAPFARVIESGS